MVAVIDPLKLKIHELLSLGAINPLNQAQHRYGTQSDVDELIASVRKSKSRREPFVMIDFTPFERFGRFSQLLYQLNLLNRPRPILMLMGEGIVAQLMSQTRSLPIPVTVFGEDGGFKEVIGGESKDRRIVKSIHKLFNAASIEPLSLTDFRLSLANVKLTDLLREYKCIETPSKRSADSLFLYGRYWRQMPNGMLITCFLNVKQFGSQTQVLTTLVYEALLQLNQCFRRDADVMREFDLFVVPNNTALFLSSSLQAITAKPIVVIDRLGPIPAPNIPSYYLAQRLEGKKVVLLEEVMATGSEVDRTVFFLGSLGASVTKIITFFNLEVGKPLLVKSENILSLSRPKQELGYVYRSK